MFITDYITDEAATLPEDALEHLYFLTDKAAQERFIQDQKRFGFTAGKRVAVIQVHPDRQRRGWYSIGSNYSINVGKLPKRDPVAFRLGKKVKVTVGGVMTTFIDGKIENNGCHFTMTGPSEGYHRWQAPASKNTFLKQQEGAMGHMLLPDDTLLRYFSRWRLSEWKTWRSGSPIWVAAIHQEWGGTGACEILTCEGKLYLITLLKPVKKLWTPVL